MRQMKFRAWDSIDNKMWYTGQVGETDEKNDGIFQMYFNVDGCLAATLIWIEDISYEQPAVTDRELKVMEYTGLKDKNGVEIYEGDIVNRIETTGYTFVGEVIFEEYGFGIKPYIFFTPLSEKGKYDDGKSSFDFSVEYEVIGNVFEHPELLGDSK